MKRFLAAVRFLTILPLPGKLGTEERDLAPSAPFFPLVGLLIGVVAGGFAAAVPNHVLPPLPAGVMIVIVLLGVSGALHADGLSDTADGFLSSRPRERVLGIMRDSRVGVMGVIAVVCVLALKVAALSVFAWSDLWPKVVLMPVAGRCGMVIAMMLLPYARSEGGLGSVFYRNRSPLGRWACAIWAAAVLAVAAWLLQGVGGLIAAAAAIAAVLLFSWHCHRRIQGATGDTLGATCEIAETAIILAFSVYRVNYLSAGAWA